MRRAEGNFRARMSPGKTGKRSQPWHFDSYLAHICWSHVHRFGAFTKALTVTKVNALVWSKRFHSRAFDVPPTEAIWLWNCEFKTLVVTASAERPWNDFFLFLLLLLFCFFGDAALMMKRDSKNFIFTRINSLWMCVDVWIRLCRPCTRQWRRFV